MRYVTRKEITSKLNLKIELFAITFVRDFSYKFLWLKSYEKSYNIYEKDYWVACRTSVVERPELL